MTDLYFGREQSEAKHQILARYLIPFANKILSTWASIDFIDGFSGPWEHRDTEHLSDTSIGISLKTLSDVAEALGHTPEDRRIRCIFNEAKPSSYRLLAEYVARVREKYPLLKIETFEGEFATNAPRIRAAADHAFQLLFVDPTGYTGFPPSALKLFNGRSSEVIVNFMRSFMERFVSSDHKDRESALVGLLGEKRARYLIDTGVTIELVEAEYLKMLRADLKYKYAAFSPIHNPDKNMIQFNLAYATWHHEGMEVMRGAEFTALSSHDRARFKKSNTQQHASLFDAAGMSDDLEIRGPYLKKRQEHLERADQHLTSLLDEHPNGIAFAKFAAIAQQDLFLKRSELGDVVVAMANRGKLQRTWKTRSEKAKKPNREDMITRV